MRRYFSTILLAALLLPLGAQASVTWFNTNLTSAVVCTTGDETAAPPTTDPCTTEHGLCLRGINSFTVHIEAAGAMTAGALEAWVWRPATKTAAGTVVAGQWNRAPSLDITNTTLQDETYAASAATGGVGGIAFIPNTIGQASTIFIIGTRRP